jgi:hypothetical protein
MPAGDRWLTVGLYCQLNLPTAAAIKNTYSTPEGVFFATAFATASASAIDIRAEKLH